MYSKFVSVLVLVVLLFVMCAGVVDAGEPAYSGTEPGKGEGGPVGEDKWNNDPDDTPNGPDRGDGTVDAVDWNNGCGNEVDRTDDNEGLCRGGSLPPAPVVVKPINRKARSGKRKRSAPRRRGKYKSGASLPESPKSGVKIIR